MEGLLPMVFKAIKKNKVRRKYECLSSSAAQSYNISDFYLDDQVQGHNLTSFSDRKVGSFYPDSNGHHLHRRYNSMGGLSGGFPAVDRSRSIAVAASPKVEKQLVRFRSHRMFSCVTGA